LALKSIDYEYRAVHLVKDGGEQHKAEYKEMNPMGLVPALCIDDVTLTDSIAIMEYLDETKEGQKFLPEDPVTKAKVRALANIIASSTQPIQNLRVLQYVGNEENKLDKVAWGHKWISDGLAGYEAMVSKTAGTYSVGDTVTMADLCIVPQLYNAQRFKVDMSAYPTIMRIAENCGKLEAFKAAHPYVQPDCPEELRTN